MSPSFAHPRNALLALALTVALAGCASLPPPTGELAAAQQAVARASQGDADQYAGTELARAQAQLSQAQAALSAGHDDDARNLALAAAAEADLAYARSRAAVAEAALALRVREVAELQQRLGIDADVPATLPAAPAETVGNHAARLQALAADARLAGLAEFERAQARQEAEQALQGAATQQAAQLAAARETSR